MKLDNNTDCLGDEITLNKNKIYKYTYIRKIIFRKYLYFLFLFKVISSPRQSISMSIFKIFICYSSFKFLFLSKILGLEKSKMCVSGYFRGIKKKKLILEMIEILNNQNSINKSSDTDSVYIIYMKKF